MSSIVPPVQMEPSLMDGSASSLCNLLLLMPYLSLTASAEIDYIASDPAILAQLADAADASLLIIHLSTSAVGRLLARTATEPFSEMENDDSVEALGWLVAELGDLASVARSMSAMCRRITYDYAPQAVTTIPLAKP